MPSLPYRQATRFWLWHLVLPLIVGLLLWGVYPQTGLDDRIEQWFYDPGTHAFPLRNALWLTAGAHSGLKLVVIATAALSLCGWIASFFDTGLHGERRRLGWIWVSIVLATTTVALLKHWSIHHCPWDITRYGGYAPAIPLFGSLPPHVAPGRCFPAGHASAGFALMALYFGLRDDRPGLARLALVGALVLGFAMGWAQSMRGAHYLSHTLWSAWTVWMVLLAAYVGLPPLPMTAKSIQQRFRVQGVPGCRWIPR